MREDVRSDDVLGTFRRSFVVDGYGIGSCSDQTIISRWRKEEVESTA